ncbi:MAG: DUF512 domain-containing protein, partial [Anaerolineae bacterium]|nr:DUF512 domain-containing protein [Anaerolineae bacterium]
MKKERSPVPPMGRIKAIIPQSAADQMGILPGDELLALNDHPCEDVIDVQFYGAEEWLEVRLRRGDQEITLSGERQYDQPLGMEFEHPTFDIDIRRCNNLCGFCFVLQMAPRMRRTLYIKDDDYRYSFLFGHFVTLTNLSDHDWERIIEQHLSPLYVSVHVTDTELRRAYLRNPDAPDILEQLRRLADHHFEVHTQLVITPGVNDGDHMERSIRDLVDLYPTVQSISVVPVGLTRFHRYGLSTNDRAHAEAVLAACEQWQARCRQMVGVGFVYPTDEWYLVAGRDVPPLEVYDDLALHENGLGMVRRFKDEWAEVRLTELHAFKPRFEHLTLVTATLFAPILSQAAAELSAATGLKLEVRGVVNKALGEGITVAGLLHGADVIAELQALKQAGELGQMIILPRIMFDHPDGISLDDTAPLTIANTLGVPVALADLMGDVLDAAQGKNALTFTPGISPADIPVVRDGGWAVEKYL